MFLFHLQEGVLLMETLEMAPSRETVTMGCYVLLMGNALVCLEYLFIVIFSENGYLNQTQCLFARQNSNFLECFADSDCTGYSDTCVSNVCVCGSTEKCSGMTVDACVRGKCKCGEHEECSETEICSVGECVGRCFLIFTKSNLISQI